MSTIEEADLANNLREALTGNEKAYKLFLSTVVVFIRRAVMIQAGGLSNEDREDIVQEVLMAVHVKRHTWRTDYPVKPWLNAIARYKVIDCLRARKMNVVPIEDYMEVLAAEDKDATKDIDIELVINHLNKNEQKVVRALSRQGKSIEETAAACGMTENNVRVVFHRALKKIDKLSEKMVRYP